MEETNNCDNDKNKRTFMRFHDPLNKMLMEQAKFLRSLKRH